MWYAAEMPATPAPITATRFFTLSLPSIGVVGRQADGTPADLGRRHAGPAAALRAQSNAVERPRPRRPARGSQPPESAAPWAWKASRGVIGSRLLRAWKESVMRFLV